MADGKRASGGPKVSVATPNIGGLVNTVPLEVALAGCIGARIRISTTFNTSFEGTLFTADPVSNLVVLNVAPPPPTPASANTPPQPGDYHIIPIARLQSFQLLALAPESAATAAPDVGGGPVGFAHAMPGIQKVDRNAVLAKERTAVDKDVKRENAKGRGVSKEGQDIYDALSRTLPVRWNNQTIVVSENVFIDPPYGIDDCKPFRAGQGETALQRVKKVLENEKKRVAERNSAGSSGGIHKPSASTSSNNAAVTPATPAGASPSSNIGGGGGATGRKGG